MLTRKVIFLLCPPSTWIPEWALSVLLQSCRQPSNLLIFPNPRPTTLQMYFCLYLKNSRVSGKTYLHSSCRRKPDKPTGRDRYCISGYRRSCVHYLSIADGDLQVTASELCVTQNSTQGNSLRKNTWIPQPFFYKLAPVGTVNQMGDFFPELKNREELIIKTLRSEEESFNKTRIGN